MTKRVLIFGGPGPAAVVGHAINDAFRNGHDEYEFAGYLNDRERAQEISGFPVLGGFDDAPRFLEQGYYFLNTVYKIGGFEERIRRFEAYGIPRERLATFVHPKAYVAGNVILAPGCVVMPNASISAGASLGGCCILMVNASIGHDTKVGDYCLFTANSCLGAWLTVGDGVWVGMNATVRGKLTIARHAAIGIGAVVTKNVGERELWIGNPARFHKMVTDGISL